jgi:hypothetical protein
LGAYHLEGYWINNLFINQNWVGEDYENVISGSDLDGPLRYSTMNLDTLTQVSGSTATHINIQPEFLLPDGTVDPAKCGLDKIKIFISNNVQYTDTILNAYYLNRGMKYNSVGPYPVSYLTWYGGTGPFKVVNVPCIWMNERTQTLVDEYPLMVESDNYIEQEVQTVTPAIKDMDVVDQMAWWNDAQWGVPGVHANDITHSAYIFGDYDPLTIPGYKTEDGYGITKFTDLSENFSQTGHIYTSTIDGLPIGSLIWDDNLNDSYNSADAFIKVMHKFWSLNGVKALNNETPESYALSQNYPNPFNPTTIISFSVPKTSFVTIKVFDVLGKEVTTLINEEKPAGNHEVEFNGANFTSGIYFYCLKAGNFIQYKKALLVK